MGPVLPPARDDGVVVERSGGAVDAQLAKAGTPMNWLVREDRDVDA